MSVSSQTFVEAARQRDVCQKIKQEVGQMRAHETLHKVLKIHKSCGSAYCAESGDVGDMSTLAIERNWLETTYGARWPSSPNPQRYQIWRMACIHCDFSLEPQQFRSYDEQRKGHPQPYGNFASISHARKVMRDHIKQHLKARAK